MEGTSGKPTNGSVFSFQLTLVQKSPLPELLEFTRKFIPESKVAPPCGASSTFRRFHRSKSPSRAENPENSDANCAPVRSILKILMHIALPCGTSPKFRCGFIKTRAPVRSILIVLHEIAFSWGASLEFRRLFIKNALPCRASSKFRRYRANQN